MNQLVPSVIRSKELYCTVSVLFAAPSMVPVTGVTVIVPVPVFLIVYRLPTLVATGGSVSANVPLARMISSLLDIWSAAITLRTVAPLIDPILDQYVVVASSRNRM